MVFAVGLNAFTQLVVIIGGHPGTRPCVGWFWLWKGGGYEPYSENQGKLKKIGPDANRAFFYSSR